MQTFEDLTLSEKETFKKMKESFKGELNPELENDDFLFIRFLRARNFKLNAATDMLRKHLVWRKKYQIDTVLKDFVRDEVTVKYFPHSRIGFDKEGTVVRYTSFGAVDWIGFHKATKAFDVAKTLASYYEEDLKIMKEQSLKLGKPMEQWVYIIDYEGYNLAKAIHKPSVELLLDLCHTYDLNYPERLKKMFAINTSLYFSMIYSIVKPFLSENTVNKVNIFGKEGWKEALLNDIDADVLPAFLGGNRTDPDGNPLCHSLINHATEIPKALYLAKDKKRTTLQPDMKKLVLLRRSKAIVPFKVDIPNSMIEWEFEIEMRDIDFGLSYKEDETSETEVELIPKQRLEASLLSESGVYKCEKPGIYMLIFDNSHSWMRQKEVYLKANVVIPKDPQEEAISENYSNN